MSAKWIGIDPGSRYTGVAARYGAAVLGTDVVDCGDNPNTYRSRICVAVLNALLTYDDHSDVGIAIEDVNTPTPHLGLTRPADLITLARIIGYLERALPGAILIAPDGHGHQPWATYPDELITPGERRTLKPLKTAGHSSIMRHARSAWDVAGAAQRTARLTITTTGDAA